MEANQSPPSKFEVTDTSNKSLVNPNINTNHAESLRNMVNDFHSKGMANQSATSISKTTDISAKPLVNLNQTIDSDEASTNDVSLSQSQDETNQSNSSTSRVTNSESWVDPHQTTDPDESSTNDACDSQSLKEANQLGLSTSKTTDSSAKSLVDSNQNRDPMESSTTDANDSKSQKKADQSNSNAAKFTNTVIDSDQKSDVNESSDEADDLQNQKKVNQSNSSISKVTDTSPKSLVDPNENTDPETCVSRFYDDLDKDKLAFKFDKAELTDLESAVQELVEIIVEKVGKIDDRFKCSQVLAVGSHKEGTKIIQPDEFDFLAVIDELSKPEVVQAVKVCEDRPGFMHLRVLDENLKTRWKDFMRDGELAGFTHKPNDLNMEDRLKVTCFSNALAEVFHKDGIPQRLAVQRDTGVLKYEGFHMFREPNTQLLFVWFPKDSEEFLKIHVDMSPAVRCFNVKDAVSEQDCLHLDFYTRLLHFGSFLLTPGKAKLGGNTVMKCFRISLTEVEVELVRSLSYNHKKCYRVSKYLCGYRFKHLSLTDIIYNGISSYILKTAILHHVSRCPNKNTFWCMKDIVKLLLWGLERNYGYLPIFPSVFIKHHNLYELLYYYQTVKTTALHLIMHVQCLYSLDFLNERVRAIPVTKYSYEKCLEMLEEMVTNAEVTKQNFAKISETFVTDEGKWGAYDMSTNDMLQKFGVPDFESIFPGVKNKT